MGKIQVGKCMRDVWGKWMFFLNLDGLMKLVATNVM